MTDLHLILVLKAGVPAANQTNQGKGQNEKFMNFAHFLMNSGVFP